MSWAPWERWAAGTRTAVVLSVVLAGGLVVAKVAEVGISAGAPVSPPPAAFVGPRADSTSAALAGGTKGQAKKSSTTSSATTTSTLPATTAPPTTLPPATTQPPAPAPPVPSSGGEAPETPESSKVVSSDHSVVTLSGGDKSSSSSGN